MSSRPARVKQLAFVSVMALQLTIGDAGAIGILTLLSPERRNVSTWAAGGTHRRAGRRRARGHVNIRWLASCIAAPAAHSRTAKIHRWSDSAAAGFIHLGHPVLPDPSGPPRLGPRLPAGLPLVGPFCLARARGLWRRPPGSLPDEEISARPSGA